MKSEGLSGVEIQPESGDHTQLAATAEQLQTMADLIQKYPAEAQLLMAALEDGLTLGPMQVMKMDSHRR
jgi:hypothetical protein